MNNEAVYYKKDPHPFSFNRSVVVVELQEFMECAHWKVYTNAQSSSHLSMHEIEQDLWI